MGYAELIAMEVQHLPAQYQAEVLSFVNALKAQSGTSLVPALSPAQAERRDAMLQTLTPFSANMQDFF